MSVVGSLAVKFAEVAVGYVAGELAPVVYKQVKEHGPDVAKAVKDKTVKAANTVATVTPLAVETVKAKLHKNDR